MSDLNAERLIAAIESGNEPVDIEHDIATIIKQGLGRYACAINKTIRAAGGQGLSVQTQKIISSGHMVSLALPAQVRYEQSYLDSQEPARHYAVRLSNKTTPPYDLIFLPEIINHDQQSPALILTTKIDSFVANKPVESDDMVEFRLLRATDWPRQVAEFVARHVNKHWQYLGVPEDDCSTEKILAGFGVYEGQKKGSRPDETGQGRVVEMRPEP